MSNPTRPSPCQADTPSAAKLLLSSRHAGGGGYRYQIVTLFSGTKSNLSHRAVIVKPRYQIVIIGHSQRLPSMSSRHAGPLPNRYKVFGHQTQPTKKIPNCQGPLPNRYNRKPVSNICSNGHSQRLPYHIDQILSSATRRALPNRYLIFGHQTKSTKEIRKSQEPLPNRYKVFGVGSETSARRLRSI